MTRCPFIKTNKLDNEKYMWINVIVGALVTWAIYTQGQLLL